MGWNVQDAWPEPNKLVVRRRVIELQQQSKTTKQLAEMRKKKIEILHSRIAKLEQEEE